MDQIPDIINKIINLEDSTTLLLESLSSKPLKVLVKSQVEINDDNGKLMKRTVKLFFESSAMPVLFCVSDLYLENLKAEEYRLLMETLIPIGKIFHLFNNGEAIKKMNIRITKKMDNGMAEQLNVKLPEIICKQYDYCIGERKVGSISEFFNEESLIRVWDTKTIEIL
jgi:chorismate-pyruvate lyase